MKYRLISFLLCLTILLIFPFHCFGEINHPGDTTADAEAYVLRALETVCDTIPLTDHPMTSEEVISLYQGLLESQPQLFYVEPRISYAFDSEGFVTALYPSYTMHPEEISIARQEIAVYLEKFLQLLDESMEEGDLALLIHDHLASSFTYSPTGEENYDIYSLLIDGHGVCQAFSLMYIALGRSVGLEVDMVTSLSMDHAWNHVKVNDAYYHVDVTRDLPQGNVTFTHDRFLLSDAALDRLGYHGYTCRETHACTDHAYESTSVDDQYESAFSVVTGSSIYLGGSWLSLEQSGKLVILRMGEDVKNAARLTEGADTDGDGVLTLADVLHPNVQSAPDVSAGISDSLRQALLEHSIKALADG